MAKLHFMSKDMKILFAKEPATKPYNNILVIATSCIAVK